ncbi:MAG: hypothetical protein AB7G37_20025 [Solirubrobacteraceae bacterium]
MKVKVTFPLKPGGRNHKAIREQVLLDSGTGGIADRLLAAAQAAAGPGQTATLHRTFTKRGRLSVRINSDGDGDRVDQRTRLQSALGRVQP